MSSKYLLHWNGYQANLQSACEKQFLAESFVDVTLAVETGLIKCHRVILSACSPYFQQLLAQHQCPHPIIFMRDMQYWEVIALVDFMYRGEVSVEEDKMEQLLRAAQTLQIHGLSACLRACLERNMTTSPEEAEDSQGSAESACAMEPQTELSSTINKLCELNSELELRPITPPQNHRDKGPSLESVPISQMNVVKEEIDFIEGTSELFPTCVEPSIHIESVFSEQSTSEDKTENSNDCIEVKQEESVEPPQPQHQEQNFRQYLLVSPIQGPPPQPQSEFKKHVLQDAPLYKRYSPRVLQQALRDLQTGRFCSIRACARHHGIPMTTLRYRAKVNRPKRPHWLPD